jgi:hypothetical protein
MRSRIVWLGRKREGVALFLAVATLGVVGCGMGTGDVRGRVTYRGRPVICGGVIMVGPDGRTVTGQVNAEGHYRLKSVPAGTVRVAVVSPNPTGMFAFAGAEQAKSKIMKDKLSANLTKSKSDNATEQAVSKVDRRKWFPLPKQYESTETSGITTIIQRGDNTFDIELK